MHSEVLDGCTSQCTGYQQEPDPCLSSSPTPEPNRCQDPTYVISYFEFRARAEVLKLICLEGNLKFKVKLESYLDWTQSELFHDSPFGHLPILQIEGDKSFILAQTLAISMFLCKRGGLIPVDDMDCAQMHSLVNEVSDVRSHTYRLFLQSGTDAEELRNYVEGILPARFMRLERFINDHGSCGYAVGNHFSWADLALFDLVDESIHYGLFQFNGETLRDLEAFYKRVLNRPRLVSYLQSSDRPWVPRFYEREISTTNNINKKEETINKELN